MIGRRGLSSIAGAFAVLAVLTACSNGGPPTTPAGNAVGNNTIATQNYGGSGGSSTSAGQGSNNNQGSSNSGGNANSGSSGNSGSGNSGGSGGTIDIPSSAANTSYSVQCTNNDTVVLANAGQVKLTVTGHCYELEVDSGQNDITVDSVNQVAFNGANNNVIYHCGNAPQVSGGGTHDNVTQQSGSCASSGGSGSSTGGGSNSGGSNSGGGAAGGTINIAQTGATETDACNDSTVNILADSATITLTGHCASIAIAGDNTTVVVDSADAVAITGNSDDVTYHSGSPTVSKLGTGDNVHQG